MVHSSWPQSAHANACGVEVGVGIGVAVGRAVATWVGLGMAVATWGALSGVGVGWLAVGAGPEAKGSRDGEDEHDATRTAKATNMAGARCTPSSVPAVDQRARAAARHASSGTTRLATVSGATVRLGHGERPRAAGGSMRGLMDKVALVTGAGRQRGIGRAIAVRLAEEGCHVVVTGYPRDPSSYPDHEREAGWQGVASVAREIEELGRRAYAIEGDVALPEDVEAVRSLVESEFASLDVLVNNAALPSEAGAATILDMDDDVWFRNVDVNLNGLYLVTKSLGSLMRDAGNGGCIVNISSMAGRQGLANYGAYCATKWAMIGVTQQLALELAGDRIRVNCICPGSTDTDMMDGTFRRTAGVAGVDFEVVKQGIGARIPWGRQGEVSEQASAVAFLASDDASYITGQTLNVDGGLRMD